MFEFVQKIKDKFYRLFFRLFFSSSFQSYGKKTSVMRPMKIHGAQYITLKDKVYIQDNAWLMALRIDKKPVLSIGSGTYIGHYAHLSCVNSIIIQEDVLMADKVFISDNTHGYSKGDVPFKNQDIHNVGSVVIGAGAWLGENVCVIGAKIGKQSIIAANSVVTKDIPDYCIAAGSPAKVVKQFNFDKQAWEKVSE